MSDYLPSHTIRRSSRAKRARLTISPRDGLVVVIPKRFSGRKVPDILRDNRQWIDKHLAAVAASRPKGADEIPQHITLRAIGQEFRIACRPSSAKTVTTTERPPDRLVATGAIDNIPLVHSSLRRWLKRKAKERLVPRLHELSLRVGLSFARTRIGLPSTRWGSCSARGTISLSAALLFLPPALADYILIHELCHIKHPNHSPTFWSLVANHIPDLPAKRRHMRSARRHVPAWTEA